MSSAAGVPAKACQGRSPTSGRTTPITTRPAATTTSGTISGSPSHRPVERTIRSNPAATNATDRLRWGSSGRTTTGGPDGDFGEQASHRVQHETEPAGEGEHHERDAHQGRVHAVRIGEPARHAGEHPVVVAPRERDRRVGALHLRRGTAGHPVIFARDDPITIGTLPGATPRTP